MDPENRTRPLLAITLGDPAGVGPEVILKAFWRKEIFARCRPLVIGDSRILERASFWLGCDPLAFEQVVEPSDADYLHGSVPIYDLRNAAPRDCPVGEASAVSGRVAVEALIKACDLALSGRVDALVTAPLNQAAMNLAGFSYPGQSELLAERTGVDKVGHLLVGSNLRVVSVSQRVPLAEAVRQVTRARVEAAIDVAYNSMLALGITHPRIGVAGLNPHAGDGGPMGAEETNEILPAIQAARSRGWEVSDPLPPERVFLRAVRGEFDVVVAMYHDQGTIPLKLLSPDESVDINVGLPFIYTAVDHDPAFHLAGTGKASERGLLAAIDLAIQMVKASDP